MVMENKCWTLIRFNKDTRCYYDINERFIGVENNINIVF